MAAPRSAAPTPNIAPFIAIAAVLLGAAAAAFRLPGAIIAWALLLVAVWMSTPPQLTGKKDAAGYPTVGNPGEGKKLNQHRRWSAMKWRLIASPDWLFGEMSELQDSLRSADSGITKARAIVLWLLTPPTVVTWLAIGVSLIVVTLPVDGLAIIGLSPDTALWMMWPNALAAYICVKQFDASSRKFAAASDPQPAISIPAAMSAAEAKGLSALAVPVGAVVSVAAGCVVTFVALHGFNVEWLFYPWPLLSVGVGIVLASLVVRKLALPVALEDWRKRVQAREQWESRWTTLKVDPAPYLISHREHEVEGQLPILVDTFDAPANFGARGIIDMQQKMLPVIGGGYRIAVLNEPDNDSQGQPVPGTCSPIRFTVVSWPTDSTVNVLDPNLDQEAFSTVLRAAVVTDLGKAFPQPMLGGIEKLTVDADGSPAAWRVRWISLGETSAVLGHGAGAISELFDVEAIPDAAESAIYVGSLTEGNNEFTDPSFETRLTQLSREFQWVRRWTDVLKVGEQQPHIQHAVYGERQLADGSTVFTQPFMTGQGYNSERYMNDDMEKRLYSALGNPPFISIQRWEGAGDRAGERHLGAFRVVWANDVIKKNPAHIAPVPGRGKDAVHWVLAGIIAAGFDAAKLPRPELVSATPLTGRDSGLHIWDVHLRLYGNATLGDIKRQIDKIKNGMGAVEWLRVTAGDDGCRFVMGARPESVQFTRAENQHMCTALDWEQAFTDAKVITPGGQVPQLVSAEPLPKNQKVQRLVFRLPPGLTRGSIREARSKLMPMTNNVYLEDESGPTPDSVALVACTEQPVPFPAPFDWEDIATSDAIPFASGVTGEPIAYDWRLDPHLIVLGGSGTGKSGTLQNLITGALIRGCQVYIADPTKAAADFMYAQPWAEAIAITDGEASAMMDHVYAEVTRRKLLNAQYGAASYRDLPESVRPPHIVVVVDEFTSLMFTEKLERLPSNASEEEVRMNHEQELANTNRRNIGGKAGRLVREARSAGVTLILAAQELKADTIGKIPGGTSLKGNMSSILLGKTSFGSRMSALKDAVAAPELGDDVPLGRGLFESSASSAQVIQSWFDAPDHVGSMTTHIAAVREPIPEEDRLDLTVLVKSVEEERVFGRRIDDGDDDTDVDEDAIVEIAWTGGKLSLDGDVSATVDDIESTASETQQADNEIVYVGPGCSDDDAPDGAIDVESLPPGAIVTGNELADAILEDLTKRGEVRRVDWISPAAFDMSGGTPLFDLLSEATQMFGLPEVLPSYPPTHGGEPNQPEPAPPAAEPLPGPVATSAPLAEPLPEPPAVQRFEPEPAAETRVTSTRIEEFTQVIIPPPPSDDFGDLFGAPKRVIAPGEGF